MATRTLKVEIVGDARGFSRAVNDIEGHTRRMASGFSKLTTGIGIGFAALGGTAIIGSIKGLVDEAREAEKIGRITEARIKSTGGAAHVSAKDIDRLTSSLSNKVGVDDDLIASGANLLLTFKGVANQAGKNNDIFDQATRLAVDLAAGMNQGEVSAEGLKTANIQLGKALEDPIRGVTALRKAGVTFTDAQRDQIKALVESGKKLEAQKVILKAVGEQFSGTAAAASDPWQRLGVVLENVKEDLGKAILPTLNNVATAITETLIPALRKWWKDHLPEIREGFRKVQAAIKQVWAFITEEFLPKLKELKDFYSKDLKKSIEGITQAWDDNKTAMKGVGETQEVDLETFKKVSGFLGKVMARQVERLTTLAGIFARAWTIATRLVNAAVNFMVVTFMEAFRTIIRAMATVAEKLHLPFAKGLREMEQDMGHWVRDFNYKIGTIHGKRVSVTAVGVWVPPKGMGSMHGIVGATGGYVTSAGTIRRAAGGPIDGPGTSMSDSIPARLSKGEFVMNAAAVRALGLDTMHAINNARGFAAGGLVDIGLSLPSPGRMAGGIQRSIDRLAAAIDRLTVRIPIQTVGPPHVPGGWQVATAFLRSIGVPFNVISSFRPGARTHASGRPSFHSFNRAVDLTGPNMLRIFEALTGTNPTELIYSGASRYKSSSGWHPIGRLDPITLADHWSHVHAAYDRGGWLRPGWTMAWNGTGRAERVSPPGGGGDVHVHLHGPVYGDRQALIRELRDGLRQARRLEGRDPATV